MNELSISVRLTVSPSSQLKGSMLIPEKLTHAKFGTVYNLLSFSIAAQPFTVIELVRDAVALLCTIRFLYMFCLLLVDLTGWQDRGPASVGKGRTI